MILLTESKCAFPTIHNFRYDFELAPEAGGRRGGGRGERKSRWSKQEDVEEVIEGFRKASLSLSAGAGLEKKNFPPPELPRNYQPKCSLRKSRFEARPEEALATTNPTPRQRQAALAATEDERVAAARAEKTKSDEQLRKFLDAKVPEEATKSLSSFQPFSRHPEKQKRYEKYLVCVRNKREDALSLLQPRDMTEWERERERVEFARAAALYRPLAGAMGSKFVSAGGSEDVGDGNMEKSSLQVLTFFF